MVKLGPGIAFSFIAFLGACAPGPQVRELSNPSVNALMAQEIPVFFATLRVANKLATDCPSVVYDTQAAQAIIDARTRSESGQFTAIQNRNAIDLESDIAWRSLQARFDGQDACQVAATEIEGQTAVSAVLVRS